MGAAVRDFSPRGLSDGWNDERICAERDRRRIWFAYFVRVQGSPWTLARRVRCCVGVAVEVGAMRLLLRRGCRGIWRDAFAIA